MMVRKVVAGSALAAGLGMAGLLGAAPAFAGPGVNFDNGSGGTNNLSLGDTTPASGAYANAAEGNRALAVSTGLTPGGATAVAQGKGNNVVSIDGHAVTGPQSENNNVVTILGGATVNGKRNNVLTVGGVTGVDKSSHDNTIVNLGGAVQSKKQGEEAGALSVSVCGNSIGGQTDHIKVSTYSGGLCGGGD
jgi:hypothetical protein